MKLLNHTKKTVKSIAKISDGEIKNNAKEKQYLESHSWYDIGIIFQTADEGLEYEFEIMASYDSGKFAVVQYINGEHNCVWQAASIADLNSVMYHEINLHHYVIVD